MKRVLVIAGLVLMIFVPQAMAAVADFENNPLESESYWNGSDLSTGFVSGDAWFGNNYDTTYGSWDGFSYSNTTDTITEGYTNQFSAFTGSGKDSDTYGIAFDGFSSNPTISFGAVTGEDYDSTISGAWITNTTYAYLSMTNGDSFAKKFGGDSGDDEDWFLLTITGVTENGYTPNTVEFYLADFRFEDNNQDYIVDNWTWVDFSSLGDVIGLEFSLTSSDVGQYGMNTPAYFAMDDLNAVPVPGAIILLGSGLLGIAGCRRQS